MSPTTPTPEWPKTYWSQQYQEGSDDLRLRPDLYADWRLAGSWLDEHKDDSYSAGLVFTNSTGGVFLFEDDDGLGVNVGVMGGVCSIGAVRAIIANYGMMYGFGAKHFREFLPAGDLPGSEARQRVNDADLICLHKHYQARPWKKPVCPPVKQG